MTDPLWDDADLQAFLNVKSARQFRRVKKRFPKVCVPTDDGRTVERYDPADVRAVLEGMKTARPRAQHVARRTA